MIEVEVAGRRLQLWPERAAFLPDDGELLVADAHFGKAHAFRRLGVPVPGGTTAANLAVLSRLVERCGARSVVFLGDLLHARHGRGAATLAQVAEWRERHAGVAMTLVRGNHDSRAGDPPGEWRIEVVDEPLVRGAIVLCHHPRRIDGAYVLAGHLHPACVVGRGFERMRLPCFHLGAEVGVLPAFGAFTGTHVMRAQACDRLYAVADDSVRQVPALALPIDSAA